MEYTIYIKGMYDNRIDAGVSAWICGDKEGVEKHLIENQLRIESDSSRTSIDLVRYKGHFQLELYALYCAIYNGTNYWEDDFIVVSNNTAVVSWINNCDIKTGEVLFCDEPYKVLLNTIVKLLHACRTKSLRAVHVKKNDSIPRNVRLNTIAQKTLNELVMEYYSDISKQP